jgi:hypothetical protein
MSKETLSLLQMHIGVVILVTSYLNFLITKIGSEVLIKNVKSANNPVGTANSGFNGTFAVTGISSAREFVVALNSTVGPGTFTSDTTSRTTSLPTFAQKNILEHIIFIELKKFKNMFLVFKMVSIT